MADPGSITLDEAWGIVQSPFLADGERYAEAARVVSEEQGQKMISLYIVVGQHWAPGGTDLILAMEGPAGNDVPLSQFSLLAPPGVHFASRLTFFLSAEVVLATDPATAAQYRHLPFGTPYPPVGTIVAMRFSDIAVAREWRDWLVPQPAIRARPSPPVIMMEGLFDGEKPYNGPPGPHDRLWVEWEQQKSHVEGASSENPRAQQ